MTKPIPPNPPTLLPTNAPHYPKPLRRILYLLPTLLSILPNYTNPPTRRPGKCPLRPRDLDFVDRDLDLVVDFCKEIFVGLQDGWKTDYGGGAGEETDRVRCVDGWDGGEGGRVEGLLVGFEEGVDGLFDLFGWRV